MRGLWLAALLWPVVANAQQAVDVKAGEHNGFTRLVFTAPLATDWNLGRSGSGYRLNLGEHTEYDTDRTFRRIPRNRIKSLTPSLDGEGLEIDLACECHATAFKFRPNIIVVDITDGAPPKDSRFEVEVVSGNDLIFTSPHRPRRSPWGPPPSYTDLGPRRLHAAAPERGLPIPLAIPDIRATQLQEQLLHDISRAVASGTLTARGPQILPKTPPLTAEPSLQAQITQHRPPQISSDTPDPDLPEVAVECPAPALFDLPSWGDENTASQSLGQVRAQILGEFDAPSAAKVQEMAQAYIYLGFGAEADELLQLWGAESEQTVFLREVATTVDNPGKAHGLQPYKGCDSAVALWATLQSPVETGKSNVSAVLRSFSLLPSWHKQVFGPLLIERFLQASDISAAQSIEAILTRTTSGAELHSLLPSAQIDLAKGEADRAEPKLETVAQNNTIDAPRALSLLVDTKVSRGETPDSEEILQLEAFLKESSGTDQAMQIRNSLARALVVSGAARDAFERVMPDQATSLWPLLTEKGSDADFVDLLLAPPSGSMLGLQQTTRQAIAKRANDLGFPEASLQLTEGHESDEVAIIRAKAHLILTDARAALRSIAGIDGIEAAQLRAEAMETLANYEEAEAEWRAAGNLARADRMRLLRQDWANLSPSAPQELQSLAASLQEEATEPTSPLALAKARVEAAAQTKDLGLKILKEPANF